MRGSGRFFGRSQIAWIALGGCGGGCAVMQHLVASRDTQRLQAGVPERDRIGEFTCFLRRNSHLKTSLRRENRCDLSSKCAVRQLE